MDDILTGGRDKPPAGWRRRLVIAAAVVAVAALVVAEHLPHSPSRPQSSSQHHRVRAGHLTGPQYGGGAATLRLRAEGPAQLASGIIGMTLPWAAAARLPRTGAQPSWYWPANGRSRQIGGLPDDRFGYLFAQLNGGWAIEPDPVGPAGCGNCAGPPVPVYYLADHARAAIMVGVATMVAPGAAAGSLWLINFPAGAGLGTTIGTARLYSSTGTPLGAPVSLPLGYTIAQATDAGLLLISISEHRQPGTERLWDPVSGRVTTTFTGVIASSPTAIASARHCAVRCEVQVLNLVTGHAVAVTIARGDSVTAGTFSQDGRYLALQVSFGDGGDGGALAMQLEVVAAATGVLTVVPHTWVSSDALTGFGWPVTGDNLVAELSFATRVQIAFWSPGSASLAVTTVSQRAEPAALIVG